MMSIWKFYNYVLVLLKVLLRNSCMKGEIIIIFNVQINEKCELVFNHLKKISKSSKCKVK